MEISESHVKVASSPRAAEPVSGSNSCVFQCLGLKLEGSAKLSNSPSPAKAQPVLPASKYPIGMGWRRGWIQVNVQERCWALYRAGGRDEATLLEWPNYTAMDRADDIGSSDVFCDVRAPSYARGVDRFASQNS